MLLPGEQVPLHIFEERYKRMIGRSLESDEPFGILLRDAEGARPIGCTAHVSEVLERFGDGRLNVLVTGEGPFRVLDRFDDPEDPMAEVEMLEPAADEGDAGAAKAAQEAFIALAERASGETPPPDALADESAWGIAARIELPTKTKQRLLELEDEGERMRLLERALRAVNDALERAEDVAERARSNGALKPG